MTHLKQVKKKSVREQEQELAELCRKNDVDALSDGEWLALASIDSFPPYVPTRVLTVTCSKQNQALSPQKKPNRWRKWQILGLQISHCQIPFLPALRSTRHLPSCLLSIEVGRPRKEGAWHCP